MTRENNEYQRTQEWLEERRGILTSSKGNLIMAVRGLGKTALTYASDLVADDLQEIFEENFVSQAMQDGIDNEPLAKDAYEEDEMVEVIDVGFIKKDILTEGGVVVTIGASPDGLVGRYGGTEFKCPKASKHTKNLIAESCPADYYDQVQICLLVTDRKWWDLVSYNAGFKPEFRMKTIRVYPDMEWRKKFVKRLGEFNAKMEEYKSKIKNTKIR